MAELWKLRENDLEWVDTGEEVVVLDAASNEYLNNNPAGAVLWRMLAVGADREGLTAALVSEFEVPTEVAEKDVDDFVQDLRRLGLLRSEAV